jgi:hypothetical protein
MRTQPPRREKQTCFDDRVVKDDFGELDKALVA